ncbi:MAG: LpxA family transferase [Candidatus Gracilibacteria bacterium]|jgi:NDP-sugar pyrophosphorylase family protein|nr:LpxA family transferase [Candidatus Gracilibacteria bacterium]
MKLDKYIKACYQVLPILADYQQPWEITENANKIISDIIPTLNPNDYTITGNVAIHKTAIIENGVVLKDNVLIGENCFVSAGAYFRGGVYLSEDVYIGPNCEVKSSFIFKKSRIAHLNYVGNSLIGEDVNFEAGSIAANHFNESKKDIELLIDGKIVKTGIKKFGALVGDNSKIGANSVLEPGSVLLPGKIIGRLEHFDQFKGMN